jgi:hypothetical protein
MFECLELVRLIVQTLRKEQYNLTKSERAMLGKHATMILYLVNQAFGFDWRETKLHI